MKAIHNKLVRDNIPDMIEKSGKHPDYSVLNEKEYIEALKCKLVEESSEVLQAKTRGEMIGELADVLEIVESLKTVFEIGGIELEKAMEKKANSNGKFARRYFLHAVTEE